MPMMQTIATDTAFFNADDFGGNPVRANDANAPLVLQRGLSYRDAAKVHEEDGNEAECTLAWVESELTVDDLRNIWRSANSSFHLTGSTYDAYYMVAAEDMAAEMSKVSA